MGTKKSFSERHGYKKSREIFQVKSMDEQLHNALWNAVWSATVVNIGTAESCDYDDLQPNIDPSLISSLHRNYYKERIDEFSYPETLEAFSHDMISGEWHTVYDLCEFVAQYLPQSGSNKFMTEVNKALEQEMAGYHFINKQIVPFVDGVEIQAIENALESPYQNVREHLNQALALLSDRKSPKYPKSMHESISAVEAICRNLTGKEDATLTTAINKMEKTHKLHHNLKEAYKNLYWYTCDEGGIRHARKKDDESNQTVDDAKYMLVVCSAFVNYIVGKFIEE